MKSFSSSFVLLASAAVISASATLLACGSSSSSSTSNGDGGTGSTGGSANTPSCSTACTHAVAACSEFTTDMCTSACGSATSTQVSCIATASSCTALQACESSTSGTTNDDGGSSGGGSSGGGSSGGGTGGTGGSGNDGGGSGGSSGDDGGCDTFTEQTYTFTLASSDWSMLDVNVNAAAYDSTGAEGSVMGGMLDNRGTTMTYSFKAYGCTPKVNVEIDYSVIGGTGCTGGPVDLTENNITVQPPTVDTTQMTCTAPVPM